MPIYEYQCSQCSHMLEAFQNMSEQPLSICPQCNKPALSKLISSTSFQLKGGGWYVTDIRDKNKPKVKEDGESETEVKPVEVKGDQSVASTDKPAQSDTSNE
ncbi:MAG: zinc ribbon domain-containing protein [Gammaproteobacteria bacterium]|nr:zinc ribbon domain-containing protein [Gammaproteobacteria bacterium]